MANYTEEGPSVICPRCSRSVPSSLMHYDTNPIVTEDNEAVSMYEPLMCARCYNTPFNIPQWNISEYD
jgi:hypothetical protein